MSEQRNKINVEIWEYAVPLELGKEWDNLTTNEQRMIVKAVEASGSTAVLGLSEDGTLTCHVIPTNFSI